MAVTVVDVVMPQMGVSVSEGTVTKWFKAVGDPVIADEPLLEISTDKVDTEVPSPGEGVLGEILVQEGETVLVGTKLATILPEGSLAPPAGDGFSAPTTYPGPAEPIPTPGDEHAAPAERRPRDRTNPPSPQSMGTALPTSMPSSRPSSPASRRSTTSTWRTFRVPVRGGE